MSGSQSSSGNVIGDILVWQERELVAEEPGDGLGMRRTFHPVDHSPGNIWHYCTNGKQSVEFVQIHEWWFIGHGRST